MQITPHHPPTIMTDYKAIAINAIRNLAISQHMPSLSQRERDEIIRNWEEIEREAKIQEAREGNAL